MYAKAFIFRNVIQCYYFYPFAISTQKENTQEKLRNFKNREELWK